VADSTTEDAGEAETAATPRSRSGCEKIVNGDAGKLIVKGTNGKKHPQQGLARWL